MKIKKLIFAAAIVCLAGAAGMLFYQRNFCPASEEVTEKKLDGIFLEGKTGNEKDGVDLAALFMNQLQETQLACAMSEPAEHQEQFFENIKDGLQKIRYEVEEISQSGEEAEVSVSINYFKLPEIVQNAQKALGEEQEKEGTLSAEDMVEKTYGAIADEFQKGPSDDSKTSVTVALHKENHQWKTDDTFEEKIFDAVLQPY